MIFEGQSLSTSEHNESLPQYPIENKAKIVVVPKQAIKDITEWWKVFPEDENMAQRIAGLQSKQPLYVRIVLSNVFHIGIAVAIVLNCVYVLIDASIRSDENATHAVWLVFELVFCVIFLVEAVLKVTAMRVEYFRDGYNNFDFFLVILGIVGAALSILTVASAHPEETQAEDSVGGTSSEARIMRVARVFRILRFLRIFRLFHAKLSMDAEVSVDLSNHMKRISTMTVFVAWVGDTMFFPSRVDGGAEFWFFVVRHPARQERERDWPRVGEWWNRDDREASHVTKLRRTHHLIGRSEEGAEAKGR